MAFGTGTHPTTQLCLQLMEKYLVAGENVMDIGCGSGILSIAAIKLGASHVLAVDVDSQAIAATLENAQINAIQPEQLETGKGSVEDILKGRFSINRAPLVLVNILAPIITRLFDQGLGAVVEDDGIILLSGILDYQAEQVLEKASSNNFISIEQMIHEDWVSLALQKSHET
jgi:ribosomal protein L11 methyltransferase